MRRLLYICILVLSAMSMMAENYASNARAEQVERTMVITYDLSKTANVRLLVATNMSNDFKEVKKVTGAVGENVLAGANRQITWNVLEEYDRFVADGVRFKVETMPGNYVDLGLPSGTLWKNANEGGDNARYTYNEAVSRFGNKLPTKHQLEELKNKCTWTWTGKGYKVTGPNGNSILLPAAGYRSCGGGVGSVGAYGSCWSSTPDGSDLAWVLSFDSSGVNVSYSSRCLGLSVRLVQNL